MEINNYLERQQESHLPPGFRFHPTDEELITYYLLKKVIDSNFTTSAIAEVDLNKCEPWHLPGRAKMGEKEWYFFSLRDRKYPTGLRTNRATESGYWKATGKDREIYSCSKSSASSSVHLVGMKKTLVFYKGRAPKGEKSNWVMHEFRLDGKFAYHHFSNSKDEWVISRLFNKTRPGSSSEGKKMPPTASISIPEVSSPSSVSLPPLLNPSANSSTDRDISSYNYYRGVTTAINNTTKDQHVPCFSNMIFNNHNSQIFELQSPPLPLMFSEPPATSSPTSCFPGYNNNSGVSAFPSLWSLQEVPHFLSVPPMYGGAEQMPDGYGSITAAGQWVKVENQIMGPTELDCMWGY